ncbi:hypothetical protein BRC93_08560 [Halobacteriales archaeon QS_5_70_15]|nr:MAG: hypothetical protein BRC93_08560 [Halobacteriales archaeon QS_5_70_15]
MDRPAVDRRGVSTTVGYVLTLSITTLLVGGLLVGLGGFVEDQREGTARGEMRVVGQQVASDLSAADRLARVGTPSEVRVTRQLPRSITGSTYRIEISPGATPDDPVDIVLRTTTPDLTVEMSVRTETPVAETTVGGGDFAVELNGSGELEVSSA